MIARRTFFGLPVVAGASMVGLSEQRSSASTLAPMVVVHEADQQSLVVYVRSKGSDTTGTGESPESAFETPQRAIDSLPAIFNRSVIIDIGPGVYRTSSRPADSLDRPAVVYIDRLKLGRRTDLEGTGLNGSLVLKLHADTVIQAGHDGYTYGIYCTGHSGSTAVWGGSIEAGGRSKTLVTAHRGTYLHLRGMKIDGSGGAEIGLLAEAGGFLECVNVDAYGSRIDLQTFHSSCAQMAANDTGHRVAKVAVGTGSVVSIVMAMTIIESLTNRGICELNGGTGNSRVVLQGQYDGRNSTLHAIRTDFLAEEPSAVLARCDTWQTGSFAFDCVLNLHGGSYNLAGSKAHVAGRASPHARPIRALPGTFIYRDGTIDWTNNAGQKTGVFFEPTMVTVPGHQFVIPATLNSAAQGLIRLKNNTGEFLRGCTLDGVAATTNGHPPDTGAELILVHVEGEAIEIVEASESIWGLPDRRLVLGRGKGTTASARFVWLDDFNQGAWMYLG